MKFLAWSFIVLAFSSSSFAQERSSHSVTSPEISNDGRVTFRLNASKASEVIVTGEFMRGSKAMVKDSSGIWILTTGPISPEIYAYNFTIDGVKTIDPGNPAIKTGSTSSTIQSLLEVKGKEPAFYDARPIPHGEIRTEWYESKSLGAIRRLTIYTPPDFDVSGRTKYPVLYLLHGANADESAWTRLGKVNLILDNLFAEKKIKPFIVVMPFGYGEPPGEISSYMSFNVVAADFEKDFIGDVLPYVDTKFPVYSDRQHRAVAGLSMGGFESLTIGLDHLDLFSYVAGFSAAIKPIDFQRDFGALVANSEDSNKKLKLLWLAVGRTTACSAPRIASQHFSPTQASTIVIKPVLAHIHGLCGDSTCAILLLFFLEVINKEH